MTTQTQTPEERLSKLEGAYEQVNERLRDLTQGQASLGASMEALRVELYAEIGKLRSEMHRQTYLIIGVIGGLVTLLRFIG